MPHTGTYLTGPNTAHSSLRGGLQQAADEGVNLHPHTPSKTFALPSWQVAELQEVLKPRPELDWVHSLPRLLPESSLHSHSFCLCSQQEPEK